MPKSSETTRNLKALLLQLQDLICRRDDAKIALRRVREGGERLKAERERLLREIGGLKQQAQTAVIGGQDTAVLSEQIRAANERLEIIDSILPNALGAEIGNPESIALIQAERVLFSKAQALIDSQIAPAFQEEIDALVEQIEGVIGSFQATVREFAAEHQLSSVHSTALFLFVHGDYHQFTSRVVPAIRR